MKLSRGIARVTNVIRVSSVIRVTAAAILILGIIFTTLVSTAPSSYAAGEITVGGKVSVVNTDGDTIRMRAGAGTEFDQVGEAYEGQTLSVLAGPSRDTKSYRWFKVQGPGGTGWIVAGYLEGASTTRKEQLSPSQTPRISGSARVANTDGDPLRMRSAASSDGKVITTLDADTVVAVKQGPLTDTSGIIWYQVSANGLTGWAMGQYLAQVTSQPVKSAPKLVGFANVANTDGDSVRVRSDASGTADVISALDPDAVAAVKQGPITDSEGTAWYQVSASGITGWVMAQYLMQSDAPSKPAAQVQSKPVVEARPAVADKPIIAKTVPVKPVAKKAAADTSSTNTTSTINTSTSESAPPDQASTGIGDRIVSIAMKYVGYPYVWGGTTPRGFDCTGFLYYVYNKAGVSMPRDMGSQFNSGPRIGRSDLQSGDLLFWSNTYKRGLSHAGIYTGNGQFVNAENAGTGVAVSSLNTAYWASRYTGAVRPR